MMALILLLIISSKLVKSNLLILSIFSCHIFQVMVQSHNRRMSFSLYISALAVTDTVVLLCGKLLSEFLFSLFKVMRVQGHKGDKKQPLLKCNSYNTKIFSVIVF